MSTGEKSILDDILRYGTIVGDEEFTSDGAFVRQYDVDFEGETYTMTKINGEWAYVSKD